MTKAHKIVKLDIPVYKVVESWELDSKNMVTAAEGETTEFEGKTITLYKVVNLVYPVTEWGTRLLLNRMHNLYSWKDFIYSDTCAAKAHLDTK